MLKWEAWNGKKDFSHYTCCKLRDLGGQENWSKKWCQQSSKMVSKSSFGHPRIRFLRFWKDLIEVWFLMILERPQKLKKIWKKQAEVWKKRFRGNGRRKRCASRRAFWVCKVKQSHAEFALSLGRPVPCEQGAADLRRKRQPAAHAVPCISETAEKSVKYTVFM